MRDCFHIEVVSQGKCPSKQWITCYHCNHYTKTIQKFNALHKSQYIIFKCQAETVTVDLKRRSIASSQSVQNNRKMNNLKPLDMSSFVGIEPLNNICVTDVAAAYNAIIDDDVTPSTLKTPPSQINHTPVDKTGILLYIS